MKGFMGLMERAGLVKVSETEGEDDFIKTAVGPSVTDPFAPDLASTLGEVTPSLIAADKPLEEIFALAAVPANPFPAEKLLRLLDGLRAMDTTTRKTAVLAMDTADDNWTIADPVADAQLKIAALNAYKTTLASQVGQAETNTASTVAEVKANLERTTGDIRSQITELEQLLQRETARATEETTRLESDLRSTREVAARESRRMDMEIERLNEIPTSFVQSASTN